MSKARLVITATEVDGRSAADFVADYGVSRSWVYELMARYRADGDAAFEPRSRRPHCSLGTTPATTIELQTMKKWRVAQPDQSATDSELLALIDAFVVAYNQHRPHRLLLMRGAVPDHLVATRTQDHACARST